METSHGGGSATVETIAALYAEGKARILFGDLDPPPDESRSTLVWISTGFGMNLHLNPSPDMNIHVNPSPTFVGCKKFYNAAESWCCRDENTLAAQNFLKLLQI
ncbi:hypothetical protein L2E82_31441 [Cichorium intybus]|uniref:Uncharacterized protein n=1 Tax=Cichorium intybus TaxID=13427 RepID=A0ACB9D3J9_CICIN|nr:hypothetical protein L2E82_31441 [Cichorium intybus]